MTKEERELSGAFYTPEIWSLKSKEYISEVYGSNWQEKYYIWDCCAGAGNLEYGLTNKENVFVSTLEDCDIEIIKSREDLNLKTENIFQFDFLNDDFKKLPERLQDIIKFEREKLIIYINPPFVAVTTFNDTKLIRNITDNLYVYKYRDIITQAKSQLFLAFLLRIYDEINGCKIAQFSSLGHLHNVSSRKFRTIFLAKLEKCFVVPADTFHNVVGKFQIGFFIWDTAKKERFSDTPCDVLERNGKKLFVKTMRNYDDKGCVNDWIHQFKERKSPRSMGWLEGTSVYSFNNRKFIYILNSNKGISNGGRGFWINENNLLETCVFYSVMKIPSSYWYTDGDKFLFPKKSWEQDFEFQNNCIVFAIFNTVVYHDREYGNCWNPFSEGTLKDFMENREFSDEAKNVLQVAKEIFEYGCEVLENSELSFYEIRCHFSNKSKSGKNMKTSWDEKYSELLSKFMEMQSKLADKIEEKIYFHGFCDKVFA